MPNRTAPIARYIRLVRMPNLLIILLTQYFTAIFIVGNTGEWSKYLFDKELFMISLSTMLVAAAGYIINDYYDIKIDYINKPHRVIVGRDVKRRHAIAAHHAFTLAAIVIGFIVHPAIALINSAAAFALWHYSSLKTKPFVGNLIVAALTALCLILLALHYRQNEMLILAYAFFAFGLTLIREALKDMEDLEGDSDYGRKTLPVILGIRKSKWILFFFTLVFIMSLFFITLKLNNQAVTRYFFIFMIPMVFFIVKLVRSDRKSNFSFLSSFCKFLMLCGILSMIFF